VARNQLVQITAPNLSTSVKDDSMKRRILKTVIGSTIDFLCDKQNAGGAENRIIHGCEPRWA
jgi:hypothetical protein